MSVEEDTKTLFERFLDSINRKEWGEAHSYFFPAVVANDVLESREVFVARMKAITTQSDVTLRAETVSVDKAAESLAARLIATPRDAASERPETWELDLVFFEDGLISRYYTIVSKHDIKGDMEAPAAPPSEAAPTTTRLTAAEIASTCREYIYSYNDGTYGETIQRLWAPEVRMAGKPFKAADAPGLMERVLMPVIAGLKYGIEEMIVDEEKQQIALRLSLKGAPHNKNLQAAHGGSVEVYEHATYGFEDGKMAWGWAAQDFDMSPPPQ